MPCRVPRREYAERGLTDAEAWICNLGQSTTAPGDLIEVVRQQPDDLAETQRHDSQVVPA